MWARYDKHWILTFGPVSGDDSATTGVSRSGRIRKKSSKLRDYQSPDDWEGTAGPAGGSLLPPGSLKIGRSEEMDTDTPPMESAPKKSIYMSEKNPKQANQTRAPRKDKGRTRLTAYMLYARSVKSQLEHLDFTAKSQRLGELWANVSTSERLLWKRRVTAYNRNQAKQAAKAAAEAQKQAEKAAMNKKLIPKSREPPPLVPQSQVSNRRSGDSEKRSSRATVEKKTPQNTISMDSTDPINIAAHLKLLGDSLTNIGQSLEQHEHKGHNSITGTVSVLLDSLLCSVVPLISLTTQIEGFGHRVAHLKDTFQNTLDNIAYVMPGLPF